MTRVRIEIGERVLRNGLTLLAVRNPGVRTFAAGVLLDVDQRDDPRDAAGLAHMVGACLDEGTQKRTGLQLAEELDRLGSSLEGSSSGGVVQCPAEVETKALALLAEVVFEPSFPAREVTRVREEVLSEIKADEDDPRAVAHRRFSAAVYGRHPYGRMSRGTARTVAAMKPAALRRFHRQMFVPDRGYVAAAGPHEVERTLDRLQRAFGKVRGTRPERPVPKLPALPAASSDLHVPMKREQVHVYLGHLGIRRTDPDFHALSVMDHILGTGPGFTSRISRRLRDEMGLCYAVDAAITRSAREEPGCFAAYIGTSPQHRQLAVDGFLREMRRIRDRLASPKELEDVQAYLTGSFVWQLERNAALARYAIRAKRFGLGFDYMHRYPDLIRAVTRQEVRRVARAHLHPDAVTVVSAGAG